jgi:hypothetical protein
MTIFAPSVDRRKAPRTRWAALLAVAALLIQALVPAAALAAQATGEVRVQICTAEGAQTVVLGHDGKAQKGFAGLPCHDCLGAAAAVVITPELAVLPIAYAVAPVRHAQTGEAQIQPARPPPRPPGQGPPVQTI